MDHGIDFGYDVSGNAVLFVTVVVCNLLVVVKTYIFYGMYLLIMFGGIAMNLLFAKFTHGYSIFTSFGLFY